MKRQKIANKLTSLGLKEHPRQVMMLEEGAVRHDEDSVQDAANHGSGRALLLRIETE